MGQAGSGDVLGPVSSASWPHNDVVNWHVKLTPQTLELATLLPGLVFTGVRDDDHLVGAEVARALALSGRASAPRRGNVDVRSESLDLLARAGSETPASDVQRAGGHAESECVDHAHAAREPNSRGSEH
jgi:hypothetical protein